MVSDAQFTADRLSVLRTLVDTQALKHLSLLCPFRFCLREKHKEGAEGCLRLERRV